MWHMPSSTKNAKLNDCVFAVDENVYEPSEDTFLFCDNMNVLQEDTVLDLGTGCGALGIVAAMTVEFVLAIDVNPHAVRCAKLNAVQNGVSNRMAFMRSDLFSALGNSAKFTLILFNAPYLPVTEGGNNSWVDLSWNGGASGRFVIDRFIVDVQNHLTANGRVLLMQSNLAGVEETFRRFDDCGMTARKVAEIALPFFETLFLIEAKPA